MINGINTLAVVDVSAHYSVITTEFLDELNITCNNVKFIRERIILYEKHNTEILGKIKRFEFILKNTLLHHDVYILDSKLPLLLLGQDWMNKHEIRYNISRTHLILKHQFGKICTPIYQQEKESNPKLIKQSEENPIERIIKHFESDHETRTSSEIDNNNQAKEVEARREHQRDDRPDPQDEAADQQGRVFQESRAEGHDDARGAAQRPVNATDRGRET